MPFWNAQAERGVFGQDPDTSAIQLDNGKESTAWSFPDPLVPSVQPSQSQLKVPGDGSLADYYDLTKALDEFTFDAPESPPSSSDDDSSSDHDSSPSLPDLSPNRSFTLLTLDNASHDTLPSTTRPWEQYLPKTTPAHLRAFRLNGRRPKPSRLQQQRPEPPKLLLTQEPQLLDPIETNSGLNIDYNDTSFLLPSPLSPCMPKNFPRAPQNSPDSAYFPSPTATSAPIPIPTSKINKAKDDQPAMEQEPVIFTATCRRTPYYPPNSSQTEDRSRVYMNRGPHYIANWTPLSSLPIDAQKKIERSMVKFTAPEGKEDSSAGSCESSP